MCSTLLAAVYSHAALREKVMSIVTELKYSGIAFGRNYQSLSYELIKNGLLCPFNEVWRIAINITKPPELLHKKSGEGRQRPSPPSLS